MVLESSGYLVAKLDEVLDRFCNVGSDLVEMVDVTVHQLEANHTTSHCNQCCKFGAFN
jgi:hypothetical protein